MSFFSQEKVWLQVLFSCVCVCVCTQLFQSVTAANEELDLRQVVLTQAVVCLAATLFSPLSETLQLMSAAIMWTWRK